MAWLFRIGAIAAMALVGALAAASAQVLAPEGPDGTGTARQGPTLPSLNPEPWPYRGPFGSPDFHHACRIQFAYLDYPGFPQNVVCPCLVKRLSWRGLRRDAFDFLARSYSETVENFVGEYTHGGDWLEIAAELEEACIGMARSMTSDIQAWPPAGFPRAAASWGGLVRAGPGPRHEQVDSLPRGERVSLLEDTGFMWQGFPWFRISYRDGRQGYHWGGIMCAPPHGFGDPGLSGQCPEEE